MFLFLCTGTALSASVAPEEEWSRTFEGSDGSFDELVYSVQETRDGGYVLVRGYSSMDGRSPSLTKLDPEGNEEWNIHSGDGWTDVFNENCLQQTRDGGYVLAATNITDYEEYFWYNMSYCYAWLAKVNSNGTEEWSRNLEGEQVSAYAIQETDDGGYAVAGSIYSFDEGSSMPYLIKTDSNGIEEWNRTLGNSSDSVCNIQKTKDSGFILSGYRHYYNDTALADETEPLLIKMDSQGNEEWNKTIEGTNLSYNMASLRGTVDGGYVLTGSTGAASGIESAVLIKIDSNGSQQWNRVFSGANRTHGNSVKETSDGGYIIGGEITSLGVDYHEPSDAWLIKTDSDGIEEWNMTIGRPVDEDTTVHGWITSVQETSDKGYILAGETDYIDRFKIDAWVVKLSERKNENNETGGDENETGGEDNETDGDESEITEIEELHKCANSLKNIDNCTRISLNNRIEEIACHIENGEEERVVCKLNELIKLINKMSGRCELDCNQAAALIEKTQKTIESIEN